MTLHLMNILSPGFAGCGAAWRIKANAARMHSAILAITSYRRSENGVEASVSGYSERVSKPSWPCRVQLAMVRGLLPKR